MSKITGDTPHGNTNGGNPLGIGGYASGALTTAVTAAKRVWAWFDLYGRLRVSASPASDLQTRTVDTSADASSTPLNCTAAPGAGKVVHIDNLIVSVGASALVVTIKEETSNTVVAKLNCAANSVHRLGPLGKLATANKKLLITTSGAGQVDATTLWRAEA